MSRYSRMDKVNKNVKKILANIINKNYKDENVGIITVNEVDVSRDLKHAKVFTSVYLEDYHDITKEKVIDILNNEEYFIKNILKKRITLKYLPKLKFILDESMDKAEEIYRILDKEKKKRENEKKETE